MWSSMASLMKMTRSSGGGIDIVGPLAASALLDDHWDDVIWADYGHGLLHLWAFGVRRLAFGVWRLAFGRSAFGRSGVRRSAFGPAVIL